MVLGAEINAWLLNLSFQLFGLFVHLFHLLIKLLLQVIYLRLQEFINDRANLLSSLFAVWAAIVFFCFEGLR